MSYDDYVKYIVQKYRLAITLAVIKTKPEDTNLEEHIQQLRNKFSPENMEVDDLNISINSDDFQFDETNDFGLDIDINIDDFDVNDKVLSQLHNKNNLHHESLTEASKTQDLSVNISQYNAEKEINKPQNESYYVIDNQNEINNEEINDTQNLNDSITILQNYESENKDKSKSESETIKNNNFDEVMVIFKEIENGITNTENDILKKRSSNRIQENYILTQLPESMDETQCYTDIEDTCCASAKKSIAEDKENCLIDANYISKLKCDKKINENIAAVDKISGNENKTNKDEQVKANITTECINEYSPDNRNRLNNTECTIKSDIRDYRHTKEFKNIYKNIADIFGTANDKDDKKLHYKSVNLDKTAALNSQIDSTDTQKWSQNMIMNTIQDFTCKTHYSQSQINDIITIEDKYIHGIKRNNNENKYETSEVVLSKKKKEDDISITKGEVISKNIQQIGNKGIDTNVKNISPQTMFLSLPLNMAENRNISTDQLNIKANTEGVYSQDSIFSQDLPKVAISSKDTLTFGQYYEQKDTSEKSQNIDSVHVNDVSIKVGTHDRNEFTVYGNNSNFISNNNQYKLKDTPKIKYVEKELFSEESQLTNFSTFTNDTLQNYTPEETFRYSQYTGKIENKFKNTEDEILKKEFLREKCINFEKRLNANNQSKTAEQSKSTDVDNITENTQTNHILNTEKYHTFENTIKPKDQILSTNIVKKTNNSENLQHHTLKTEENIKSIHQIDSCTNFDDNLEDIEEITESEVEIIPFKIIEELNKVKLYLSKRYDKSLSIKGYSSDTGYRSDSSSRNSLKLSLTSSSWLDQTAHSLFNYIKECPLIPATEDITNEISLILGQLIDKLYEEEKYPTFLEGIMESIQTMIGKIHDENPEENMLTIKDESIHRVLLYNKSLHLKEYSIQKITQKLENLHQEITSENGDFEIKNILQIENFCYIFHLLEILLQKYNKNQNLSQKTQNLSQETQLLSSSTQNSQEDEKFIRKSGITDIWRKKWNPNFKTVQSESSQEKKCVLSSCSTVLNKLIVDCMESYSLISYYALKCFNVMQN